jgi:hypothetical protein
MGNVVFKKTDGSLAHPAMAHFLPLFSFEHLPPALRRVSEPFEKLAIGIINTLEGQEATVCLRKLLEAKDCAVRAALSDVQTENRR